MDYAAHKVNETIFTGFLIERTFRKQMPIMQNTEHIPNFTDGLETVPDATRRDFLAKIGKGTLFASLGNVSSA